jgi:hypothetical protein
MRWIGWQCLPPLLELILFEVLLCFLFLLIWTILYEMTGLATFITCPLPSFPLIFIFLSYKFLESLDEHVVSSSLVLSSSLELSTIFLDL